LQCSPPSATSSSSVTTGSTRRIRRCGAACRARRAPAAGPLVTKRGDARGGRTELGGDAPLHERHIVEPARQIRHHPALLGHLRAEQPDRLILGQAAAINRRVDRARERVTALDACGGVAPPLAEGASEHLQVEQEDATYGEHEDEEEELQLAGLHSC
jgi:hypothetical protein